MRLTMILGLNNEYPPLFNPNIIQSFAGLKWLDEVYFQTQFFGTLLHLVQQLFKEKEYKNRRSTPCFIRLAVYLLKMATKSETKFLLKLLRYHFYSLKSGSLLSSHLSKRLQLSPPEEKKNKKPKLTFLISQLYTLLRLYIV